MPRLIDQLTELQLRILASLEEAGEEYASALLNTVTACEGDASEVVAVKNALCNLTERGLIQVAHMRDQSSLHWIPIAAANAHAILSTWQDLLTWSRDSHIWKFAQPESAFVVLLTQSGLNASKEVIQEYGWGMAELRAPRDPESEAIG